MSVYVLKRTQKLPIDIETAWDFFCKPDNLKEMTPSYMGFEILSNSGSERMYAGQIITYHVRPILGIPLFWMTEITQVKDKEYFVDEQRTGPYKMWHHTHFFRAINGGVEMTDIVHYQLPLGFLGRIVNTLFVKNQLSEIYDFRFKSMEQKFGKL
jgi:ligand-binding SRPBCC domain-containing protein